MLFPRVTLRCLTKDLGLKLPQLGEPLIDKAHPILAKSKDLLKPGQDSRLEHIKSIDDNRFYRYKPTESTRAAIWVDPEDQSYVWIVASGNRLGDSYGDFYKNLERICSKNLKDARQTDSGFNKGKNTYSSYLLPNEEDQERLSMDALTLMVEKQNKTVQEIMSSAVKNIGKKFEVDYFGLEVEIFIESNDFDEIYVNITMNKSGSKNLSDAILKACIPSISYEEWELIEFDEIPSILSKSWNYECHRALLYPGWHKL